MSKFEKTSAPVEWLQPAGTAVSDGRHDRDATVRVLRQLLDDEIARNKELEFRHAPTPERIGMTTLAAGAKQQWSERRLRVQYFAPALFSEPGWDMLLGLYVADPIQGRVRTTRLAEIAGAALTTALRWIDYLEGAKLIERQPHPNDRRIVWVVLTDRGRELMNEYFTNLQNPGYRK